MKQKSILLLISVLISVNALNTPFEKVIVLMMENHSYDNMLGYLDAPIGTLKETPFCNEVNGKKYCTSPGADFQTKPDPPHIYQAVTEQLFGTTDVPGDCTEVPSMGGFAQNYLGAKGNPQTSFDCYTKEQVPIISTLAEEFMIYDRWFCSVPTSTDPNRYFTHAASSEGKLINMQKVNLDTIEVQLGDEGYSWEIHWQGWCPAQDIYPLNTYKDQFILDQNFYKLYQQFENGTLPDYTFLLPRISEQTFQDPVTGETVTGVKNTQHPSEDVRNGEQLIKEVYEHFRNSQYWNNTLLLITYDEHGGFPDHVAPPSNVSNPTPGQPGDYDFAFNRLGPRVPSIAISPWIKKGIDSTQLEHASIAKTLRQIFDLKSDYLNIREEQANSFLNDNVVLNKMRTNCPTSLPEVPFNKDYLYNMKPENHQYTEDTMYGIPEDEFYKMGAKLLNMEAINPLKWKQIVSSVKNNDQAMQFVSEGQVLLGFRSAESIPGFKYLDQNLVQKLIE